MHESEFEQRLYQERRDKLKAIAELGSHSGLLPAEATYPNTFPVSITVPELRAAYDALSTEELEAHRIHVAVAGRVMAIRLQGKAGFAQIQQGGQRIQIYVRKDDVGEDAFALYKLLDLGDHIGVRGFLMRTRTGELTVHAAPQESAPALTFLAKAMLALPDKFHGLEDTELRYRQRYVDLFVNPEVRDTFVKRAAVLRAIRRFFDDRGYLEVETPMLHTIAGGAAARPFRTHHNALDIPLSLRIAPELFLKRLVVGGMDRVYEINRNFRNEGISTQHNPEFTMLEFYQAYANYHDLMDLTQELITYVAMEVNGTTITSFNGKEIDLGKWTRLTMKEAILRDCPRATDEIFIIPRAMLEFLEAEALSFDQQEQAAIARGVSFQYRFDTFGSSSAEPEPYNQEQLIWLIDSTINEGLRARKKATAIRATAVELRSGAAIGKAITAVFELFSESRLIQPTIIYDFPLAVSPLSKINPKDPEWVERFEFYIGGFEVGNAFSELNDPDDQRRRFEDQLREKERGDDEAHAMDEDYVRALGFGLPPTAGEGIGIDRLTMILTGSKSIRDVILFPLMRPLGKAPQPE